LSLSISNYKEGKDHGQRLGFFYDGAKIVSTWKNGQKDGDFKSNFLDGRSVNYQFENGEPHGKWVYTPGDSNTMAKIETWNRG
jgi:antitoxin component YwqK of YwqJK toxin-antitoxin module